MFDTFPRDFYTPFHTDSAVAQIITPSLKMAQPDVVTAPAIDFDFSLQRDSCARFSDDNDITTLDVNNHASSFENGFGLPDPEINFTDLPPLHRGHPDVQLREGIIRAFANETPNCERAFFAADLSQVYAQHARWVRNLPEIEPFFGM